jgi:hypothetical protein
MKTLIAASVVAFLAMPLSAGAAGDKASSPSAAGSSATLQSMDKNKDGSLSRDEVKGTPQEKDFARLDKNNDGKLSRQELETATGATGGSGAAGSAAPRPAEPKTSK